jgi:hypothetical protein
MDLKGLAIWISEKEKAAKILWRLRKKELPELDEETVATVYAFFTHALHHPLEETALPPKARHGAVASFGVP